MDKEAVLAVLRASLWVPDTWRCLSSGVRKHAGRPEWKPKKGGAPYPGAPPIYCLYIPFTCFFTCDSGPADSRHGRRFRLLLRHRSASGRPPWRVLPIQLPPPEILCVPMDRIGFLGRKPEFWTTLSPSSCYSRRRFASGYRWSGSCRARFPALRSPLPRSGWPWG